MTDNRPQVAQTPLSQKGVSLQSGVVSARRGLVSNSGSLERSPQHARVLNNYQMLRPGIWTCVGIGWTEDRASVFNSGGKFLGFGRFIDNAGVRTLLFQAGSKLYSYNFSTHTETEVATGLSTTAYPTMRGFYSVVSNKATVIYCNGDTEPKKVTALNASSALQFNGSGWPGTFNGKTYSKPKFVEPFGTRAVFTGFPDATTAFDVLISDHLNPETFTKSTPQVVTDAVAFTYPPELGQITSCKVVTLSNDSNSQIIICGCTDGVFAIFGDDAGSYGLRILTTELGILSNNCFVKLGNEIIYLSTSGIRALSALTLNATLPQDALSWPIQDLIDLIDADNAYKAHAVHNPKTQEVQFWVPLVGDQGVPKHCFVMKYESLEGALAPIWSTKDGTEVTASILFKNVIYGGDSNGVLQVHYSGNTYNGAAIAGQIILSLVGLGHASQRCSVSKCTIVTDGASQIFRFVAHVFTRMDNSNMNQLQAKPGAKELTLQQSAATALGSWTLGQSAFPSNHIKTVDYSPLGNGIWWEFELSTNASNHTLDFVEVDYILSGGGVQR